MKRIKSLIYIFSFVIMLTGCGKRKDKGGDDDTVSSTDITGTVEDSTEDTTTEEPEPFDYSSLKQENEPGIYNIISLTDTESTIVDAAVYDEDHIVVVYVDLENGIYTRKIDLITVSTGERVNKLTNQLDYSEDVGIFINMNRIVNVDPLVIENNNFAKEIFNEDMTGFIAAYWEYGDFYSLALSSENDSYYLQSTCGVIYSFDYNSALSNESFDGSKVDITQYVTKVYEPEYYLDSVIIESFDENNENLVLKAMDSYKNETVELVYDPYAQEYVSTDILTYETFFRFTSPDRNKAIYEDYMPEYGHMGYYFYDTDANEVYITAPYANKYVNTPEQLEQMEQFLSSANEYQTNDEFNYGMAYPMFNPLGLDDRILLGITNDWGNKYYALLLWDYTDDECKTDEPMKTIALNYLPYDMHQYEPLSDELEERFTYFKEAYNINIIAGNNVMNNNGGYSYGIFSDEEQIKWSLDEIEEAIKYFPDGMFNEFGVDWVAATNIYLVGDIIPEEGQVDPCAYVTVSQDFVNVVVDCEFRYITQNIIHEFVHVIENRLMNDGVSYDLDLEWTSYNPEGFSYYDYPLDYQTADDMNKYTRYDDNADNDRNSIYFIDAYAKSNTMEDKARTIEMLSKINEVDQFYAACFDSVHVRSKLECFVDYLKDNLDCFSRFEESQFGVDYNAAMSR